MFEMRAQCGLPSFKPNNTDGLDIQYLQFDDEDGEPVGPPPQGSRLLQQMPPPPQNGSMPPPPPGSQPPPPGT